MSIKIENTEVVGWEATIRGMRNPKNSWDKSDTFVCNNDCPGCSEDSCFCEMYEGDMVIGPNDLKLMASLAKGGPVHGKYRRMIAVYLDITAPLYWWKEFDTYKVGTVANSCSTMHKIHDKEFTLDDFSHEHLLECHDSEPLEEYAFCAKVTDDVSIYGASIELMDLTLKALNFYRNKFLETKDKRFWWQMIQLLPTSYNQKRTIMLNYEVLHNMYFSRKNHKLDEWHVLCDWIESLPYSELITMKEEAVNA